MNLIIAPGKEKAILRQHPWIFSGAVMRLVGNPQDGDLVDVVSSNGSWLATGLYQANESIICKVLTFDIHEADELKRDCRAFFRRLISSSINYRRQLGFFNPSDNTNVFRLIHAEGDFIPALVCDWYNGVLVMQAHSVGIHRLFPLFTELFQELLGDALVSVFDKSSATVPGGCQDGYLFGIEPDEWEISEHGNRLLINFFEDRRLASSSTSVRTVFLCLSWQTANVSSTVSAIPAASLSPLFAVTPPTSKLSTLAERLLIYATATFN